MFFDRLMPSLYTWLLSCHHIMDIHCIFADSKPSLRKKRFYISTLVCWYIDAVFMDIHGTHGIPNGVFISAPFGIKECMPTQRPSYSSKLKFQGFCSVIHVTFIYRQLMCCRWDSQLKKGLKHWFRKERNNTLVLGREEVWCKIYIRMNWAWLCSKRKQFLKKRLNYLRSGFSMCPYRKY